MLHKSKRVSGFTGPDAERKRTLVGHWLKAINGQDKSRDWCIDHGVGLTKASNETTNSAGGFLAPQDFDDAIINVRETVGAFRQGAEIRPTRSDGQVRLISSKRDKRFRNLAFSSTLSRAHRKNSQSWAAPVPNFSRTRRPILANLSPRKSATPSPQKRMTAASTATALQPLLE